MCDPFICKSIVRNILCAMRIWMMVEKLGQTRWHNDAKMSICKQAVGRLQAKNMPQNSCVTKNILRIKNRLIEYIITSIGNVKVWLKCRQFFWKKIFFFPSLFFLSLSLSKTLLTWKRWHVYYLFILREWINFSKTLCWKK